MAGVLLYLHALQKDETSTVVPLFQMIPVWGFALAWMFLGETLSAYQIVGSALVIAGGVTISLALEERRVRFKKAIFFLMATEAFLAALGGLLFKTVALETGYWVATFWNLVGFVAVALFVLSFIAPYRRQFVDLVRANTVPILGLNALNEGLSMIGGLAFSFAFLLAPLALVQTVNGFQPLFVLLYGIVLTLFFPQLGTESLVRRHIFQKVGAIAIMLFGAYMVNGGF